MINQQQKHCDREKRSVHQFKKRAGFNDDHHLTPQSLKGSNAQKNKLVLDAYRHDAWHLLFKNLTLDEVISMLLRLKNLKEKYHIKVANFP